MNYIYILLDPRDSKIRYVGKTNNPVGRLKNHFKEKGHCHRIHWIQELKSIGLRPEIRIIETIPENESWEAREIYWIKHFREIGHGLTNGTDGGDCGPITKKGTKKSASTRAKMSAWQIGRKLPISTKEKIRLAHLGKKDSPERIAQKRAWMTGRKHHTDEFKQELIKRNKTRQYNPTIMSKISRHLWDDPIKGKQMRDALIERNKKRYSH